MRGCSAVYRTTGLSGGGSAGTPRSAEAPRLFWLRSVAPESAITVTSSHAASLTERELINEQHMRNPPNPLGITN